MRDAYKILVENSKERRPLRRHNSRLEDNIKIGVGEMGWENVYQIHLALDTDWWQVQ
jgi:hypothetical protein